MMCFFRVFLAFFFFFGPTLLDIELFVRLLIFYKHLISIHLCLCLPSIFVMALSSKQEYPSPAMDDVCVVACMVCSLLEISVEDSPEESM